MGGAYVLGGGEEVARPDGDEGAEGYLEGVGPDGDVAIAVGRGVEVYPVCSDADRVRVGLRPQVSAHLRGEVLLDDLNGRLRVPVPINRFRPNLVVRGCEPYVEDRWGLVRVGAVAFRTAELCPRCAVTTVD